VDEPQDDVDEDKANALVTENLVELHAQEWDLLTNNMIFLIHKAIVLAFFVSMPKVWETMFGIVFILVKTWWDVRKDPSMALKEHQAKIVFTKLSLNAQQIFDFPQWELDLCLFLLTIALILAGKNNRMDKRQMLFCLGHFLLHTANEFFSQALTVYQVQRQDFAPAAQAPVDTPTVPTSQESEVEGRKNILTKAESADAQALTVYQVQRQDFAPAAQAEANASKEKKPKTTVTTSQEPVVGGRNFIPQMPKRNPVDPFDWRIACLAPVALVVRVVFR
jgi:hypothetical protein